MTAWDSTNYPLSANTDLSPDTGVRVDRLSSGGHKSRRMHPGTMVEIRVAVKPLTQTEAQAFLAYINAIGASRREITIHGNTYSGSIPGDSLDCDNSSGLARYSFTFLGELL